MNSPFTTVEINALLEKLYALITEPTNDRTEIYCAAIERLESELGGKND